MSKHTAGVERPQFTIVANVEGIAADDGEGLEDLPIADASSLSLSMDFV